MSTGQSLVIPTRSLQIGSRLGFDLVDASGQIIQPAGTPIEQKLFDHLSKHNIQSLTVRVATSDSREGDLVLRAAYPNAAIEKIQSAIDTTRVAMFDLIESLHQSHDHPIAPIKNGVRQFVQEAKTDIGTTLAALWLNRKFQQERVVERIVQQSTQLSLLSVAMSVVQGDDPTVSFEIGVAGLMHDCSMVLNPHWHLLRPSARHESLRKKYRRHPIESADLLNGLQGISRNILTMVSQVHEQADGTGYPRGLRIERTLPGSLLLNIADAYISLTSPIYGASKSPADALAYLCFQTTQGKFCRYAFQSLVDGLSMYPVGSKVLLDDRSKAVVVKANAEKPLMPVVRQLHQAHVEVDLSGSHLSILGPWTDQEEGEGERILKSQLEEILWRTDR